MLHEHSKLPIMSVNGLCAIRTFANRYGQDASVVPIKPELIITAKGSYKRYEEELAVEDQSTVKKSNHDDDHNLRRGCQGRNPQAAIQSARKILSNAELLIPRKMKTKTFYDIESDQALLKEGQTRLANAPKKKWRGRFKLRCI